jgi:hypothetical protein
VSLWAVTAVAATVVVVPLIVWLPRLAFTSIAAAWAIGGVLGAYVFGVFVLLAAVALGAVLAVHRWYRPARPETVPE